MLGTDTEYVPELKKKNENKFKPNGEVKDYPKGEPLSIVSSHIKTSNTPVRKPTPEVNAYSANEIEVITGPTTTGSNVNDRIARGLAALLKAVARGHKPLNIIAHSRGAVEAILIAHELQSVQSVIDQCDNLGQVITHLKKQQDSRKDSNTKDIITVLKQQLADVLNNEDFFKDLKAQCKEASINLFAIDPVPGDGILTITWTDNRFYKIPAIVKNTELYFYENERSYRGFTPLCPEPTSPEQKVRKLTLPLHHGGGAGNNASQQRQHIHVLAKEQGLEQKGKTTHVAKLLIFKLFDFLGRTGVEFNDLALFAEGRALGRTLFSNGKTELPQNFSSIYRKLYAKIFDNRHIYNLFNATCYPGMGVVKARRLLRNESYGNLHDIFTLGTTYINEEHAELMREYFLNKFKFDATKSSLKEMLQKITEELQDTIKKLGAEQVADNAPASATSSDKDPLTQSYVISPKLLIEPAVIQDFLQVFDQTVARISELYLNNDWISSDAKQKEKLETFALFTKMVTELGNALNSPKAPVASFVEKTLQLIRKGLQITISQQFELYHRELNWLINIPADPLKSFINELVLNLKDIADKSQTDETVKAIFEDPEFLKAPKKMEFIWKELRKRLNSEKFNNEVSLEILKTEFDQFYSHDFATYEKLYVKIQTFIADARALTRVDEQLKAPFAILESQIHSKLPKLIDTAARRFYSNITIASRETLLKEDFQGEVVRHAIQKYNAQDPTVEHVQSLKNQLALLSKRHTDVEEELKQSLQRESVLRVQQKTLTQQVKELQDKSLHDRTVIASLSLSINQAKEDIRALESSLNEERQQVAQLKEKLLRLNQKHDEIAQQLAQAKQSEADLKIENATLVAERNALIASLQQNEAGVVNLKDQHAQTQAQINAEKIALNHRITLLEQQLRQAQTDNQNSARYITLLGQKLRKWVSTGHAQNVKIEQSERQISRLVHKLMGWINISSDRKSQIEELEYKNDDLLLNTLSLEQRIRREIVASHAKIDDLLANGLALEQQIRREVVNTQQTRMRVDLLNDKQQSIVVKRNQLGRENTALKRELAKTNAQLANTQSQFAQAQNQYSQQLDQRNKSLVDLAQRHLRAEEKYQDTLQLLKDAETREQTLVQERNQLTQDRNALTTQLTQKQTEVTGLQTELNRVNTFFTEKLNDVNEAKNLILIQDELIPLTKKYAAYLSKHANENSPEGLKALNKKNKIGKLLEDLEQPNVLASKRVTNFYTHLNEYELELGEHRDLQWQRYCKNALMVGLTLITGILPGLIALLIYVNTGETIGKSIRFWQSRGETYVSGARECAQSTAQA